jgi:hypothetical protein
MSKITGRPKKAIKLEKPVKFHVTSVHYLIIQQKAANAGVTIPEFMRQLSINGYVKPRWTPEERDIFKAMVGMANDINRLVKTAREEGALHCMLHFEKYRSHIDYAIERLTKEK